MHVGLQVGEVGSITSELSVLNFELRPDRIVALYRQVIPAVVTEVGERVYISDV